MIRPAAAAAQMPDWDRRRFLQVSGGVAVGSLVRRPGRPQPPRPPPGWRRRGRHAAYRGRPCAGGARRRLAGRRGHHAHRHPQRVLLPHRHRARDAARGRRRLAADGQGSRGPRGPADLPAALGDAALRAVRDHRLRLQRGRRQAHRQRPVDGRGPARGARHGRRAARGDADRGPLRGRLHGRLPDLLGHGPRAPADDRAGHERRPAARSTTATRPASSSPACTAT